MKSFIALLFTSLSFSLSATAFVLVNNRESESDSSKILKEKYNLQLSAHRGNSALAPENTLATFKAVMKMGIDYIEIDVRTTKDGHLVILHDGTLNRTTDGTGPMKNYTLEELRKLSAGKGYQGAFKDERIPTLEETAQLVSQWNKLQKHKTNLYVDCKDVAPEPLVKSLKAHKLLKDAVFYGADDFLLSLKKVYPKAKLMPSLNKREELESKVERLQPYAFDVKWTSLNEALVTDIHKHGVKVFSDVLSVLDIPNNYKKATVMGVDLIQTDYVRKVYKTLLENN